MMTIAQYLAYPVLTDEDLGTNAEAHIRKGEARALKAGGRYQQYFMSSPLAAE